MALKKPIPVPLGLRFLRSLSGVNPLIVNYHMVSDERLGHVKNLYDYRNCRQFEEDLDLLAGNYTPVSLQQLLDHLQGLRELPKNAVLFTFDDGFREMVDNAAPILLQKGIPATFFLTTDVIDNQRMLAPNTQSLIIQKIREGLSGQIARELEEVCRDRAIFAGNLEESVRRIPYARREALDQLAGILNLDLTGFLKMHKPYLTRDQIRWLLDQGFSVGAHSMDHPKYRELSLEEQINQTLSSVDQLVKEFDLAYRVFAFPYSDSGVGKQFFRALEGKVDATFGTSGFLEDVVEGNFQRIGVEKFPAGARRTLKFYYLRQLIYRSLGKHRIYRHE